MLDRERRTESLRPLTVRGGPSKNLLGGAQRGHLPERFDNSVPGAAFVDQIIHSFSREPTAQFRCRKHTVTVKT